MKAQNATHYIQCTVVATIDESGKPTGTDCETQTLFAALKKHHLTLEVVDLVGESGGNPEVRILGTKNDVMAYREHYTTEANFDQKEVDLLYPVLEA